MRNFSEEAAFQQGVHFEKEELIEKLQKRDIIRVVMLKDGKFVDFTGADFLEELRKELNINRRIE